MISDKIYEQVIKEHFDLKDRETLKILVNIDEADAGKTLEGLTGKLYQMIIDKVDDIDFGLIPASKGDITKVDGIEKVIDTLETIVNIMISCKQDPSPAQIIIDCIKNIQQRTNLFEKAYALNLEIPILIYNTMVLAVMSATTYMINNCIDFIKDPNTNSFEATIRANNMSKSRDALVMKNIIKFNEACRKGEIDKVLNNIIMAKAKNLTGTATIMGVAVVGTLILSIVPIMRELIYLFFHARVTMDDYLTVQADLLQMNITNLELNDSIPQEKRDKIVMKQSKIVEKLRKAANFIAIKEKKAENIAINQIQSENRTYKFNEVSDQLPDSVASLF